MDVLPPGTGREGGRLAARMHSGVTSAVRAGGRLRGLGPSALVSDPDDHEQSHVADPRRSAQ